MARVAILADTHITNSKKWHEDLTVSGVPYHDPIARTEAVLQAMADEQQPPDLFVHLGDVVHAGQQQHYLTFDRLLRRYFNGVLLFAVVGNHDITGAIKHELNLIEPASQMDEHSVHSCRLRLGEWDLFSIDASFGYKPQNECHISAQARTNKQRLTLEWLKSELDFLSSDAKVIAFTHFPITSLDPAIAGPPPTEFGVELAKLLGAHQSKIQLVMHGHIHRGADYTHDPSGRGTSYLRFRSALCASYPLAQERTQNGYRPTFDQSNSFGYELLELPDSGPFTLTSKVLGASQL